MWGNQAASAGAFVRLPGDEGELRAERCKAHLLNEKVQGPTEKLKEPWNPAPGQQWQRGLGTQRSSRDSLPAPWATAQALDGQNVSGYSSADGKPGPDQGTGRPWDHSGPPRVSLVDVPTCTL